MSFNPDLRKRRYLLTPLGELQTSQTPVLDFGLYPDLRHDDRYGGLRKRLALKSANTPAVPFRISRDPKKKRVPPTVIDAVAVPPEAASAPAKPREGDGRSAVSTGYDTSVKYASAAAYKAADRLHSRFVVANSSPKSVPSKGNARQRRAEKRALTGRILLAEIVESRMMLAQSVSRLTEALKRVTQYVERGLEKSSFVATSQDPEELIVRFEEGLAWAQKASEDLIVRKASKIYDYIDRKVGGSVPERGYRPDPDNPWNRSDLREGSTSSEEGSTHDLFHRPPSRGLPEPPDFAVSGRWEDDESADYDIGDY